MRVNVIDKLASKKKVFTFGEAQEILGTDYFVTKVILSRLERKGWIERIEKGKYMIIPLGAEKGKYTLHEFVIGSMLVHPYAIAYWSALNHYGLTEQIPATVFIQTTSRKKKQKLNIFGVDYQIVRISEKKFFGIKKEWMEENEIYITDREKTIVDCLDKAQYCGGVIEVAKALKNGDYDKEKLSQYAETIGNSGVIRRLGYLSELLDIGIKTPLVKTRNYLYLDPTMPKKGRKNAKWRLVVNLDEKILGGAGMIPLQEIREKAREYGVPESTIERDYAQNWLLKSLSSLPLALKGGTGIRKVYIADYRFSDDLDFTLLENLEADELREKIKKAVDVAREESGINFSNNVEIQENENGFEIRVYFQTAQSMGMEVEIKIDVTKKDDENILLPLSMKRVIHPYSDNLEAMVKVYALEEIVAEKIRSLFQRTRPRDLYDVWNLKDKVDKEKMLKILLGKFRMKGVKTDIIDFVQRKESFRNAWENLLKHQLKELPEFEEVFLAVTSYVIIETIKIHRNLILTGEIGALLHDIGKLHPNFIKTQSKENIKGLSHHARGIDEFMNSQLINYLKILKLNIGNEEKTVYDFIRYHHNPKGKLLELLKKCDHKDSADDKGIVRKKQPLEDTWISSPFGFKKEKIDLDSLQKRFDDLQDNLIGLFKNYTSGSLSLTCFRESLINNLKTAFSHALGETRVPANDVTLWDHSYSTASLFKSLLTAKVCGINVDPQKAKWRIFGICWNGEYFINRGRKIAEIQTREKIIKDIKEELKKKFEDEIPIGNAIYEDLNGIYFTFPDLDGQSKEVAKELSQEALQIIYEKSNNEIWPFFTLSEASSTLTTISKELKFAYEKRKIPKMTPTLFMDGEEKETFDNPELSEIKKAQDICPICRIRPKNTKEERCKVCEDRRKGRLTEWLSNRQETIWTDEVADKNNRIALISLNFNLDKWLDGTMIGTIYSQSFEDWYRSRAKKVHENNQFMDKLKKSLAKEIPDNSFIELAEYFMDYFIKNASDNFDDSKSKPSQNTISLMAKILNTFFEDISVSEIGDGNDNPLYVKNIWKNLKEKLDEVNSKNVISLLFTQNPSPARLYRVWRETEEFFELILSEIRNNIYSDKWRRIKFIIDDTNTVSKLEDNTPYIIKIDNLEPQSLLVFHNEKRIFYTIESLEKFRFNNKSGEEAVKEALKHGFNYIALENKPRENLLKENKNIKPKENSIETEEYYPLIEITKSPLSLRLIIPALDSMKIIELITHLYNERFEKVIGKLPLNIKLLVAKRKFPLYILLDGEKRMFEGKEFKKQIKMNSWWDIGEIKNNKYYRFYPTAPKEENEKYTLDELSPISKGRIFSLHPGYFDFELLLGTADRYSIYYKNGKRGEKDYKLFTGRPYYFYQIQEILDLWDVLSSNLSNSQIIFIEEMLTSKLRKWKDVRDNNKKIILREFTEATLMSAFRNNKWKGLREETRFFLVNSALTGLLLDTIILFRHIIKKEGDENE